MLNLLLLPIAEKIGELILFLGACWMLMNGVDNELELEPEERD